MKSSVIEHFTKYTVYEDGTVLNHIDFKVMGETRSTGNRKVVTLTNSPTDKKLFDIGLLVAHHLLPNDDPQNKNTLVHKDKNNGNNHLSNLIWVKKGEDIRKYTKEEAIQARKEVDRRSRNKRDKLGLVKSEQRKWRQSPEGHYVRNRNHWNAAHIIEPEQGWRSFYFDTFMPQTHCELCHVEFVKKQNDMKQKCLEHDHMSRYVRSICCRKCNQGQVKKTDMDMKYVLLELHRYFNR